MGVDTTIIPTKLNLDEETIKKNSNNQIFVNNPFELVEEFELAGVNSQSLSIPAEDYYNYIAVFSGKINTSNDLMTITLDTATASTYDCRIISNTSMLIQENQASFTGITVQNVDCRLAVKLSIAGTSRAVLGSMFAHTTVTNQQYLINGSCAITSRPTTITFKPGSRLMTGKLSLYRSRGL